MKITTEGKKHLGALIGSKSFKREVITEKVKKWMEELSMLSKVAKFAPHESYYMLHKWLQAQDKLLDENHPVYEGPP